MDLAAKYRPQTLDEVVGHISTIRALRRLFRDPTTFPHVFLFSGPSGIGKTSLARILAHEIKINPHNIVEQDAITHASAEAMRDLIGNMRFPAMGENRLRAVILDEVHSLGKPIWETLLKDLEEPPEHLYWLLCTTELEKLPAILLTRAHHFPLKPIAREPMRQRLIEVCIKEGYVVNDKTLDLILETSHGSLRQALSSLSVVRVPATYVEAEDLLSSRYLSDPVLEFCTALSDARNEDEQNLVFEKLRALKNENPETIRQAIIWHATRDGFYRQKPDRQPKELAKIMAAFGGRLEPSDGMGALVVRIHNYFHPNT